MAKTGSKQCASISIWRYLAATLAPVVLLFLSVFGLIHHLNNQIKFTQNEIQGVTAIQIIHSEIIHLQKIRGLSEILVRGGEADLQEIKSLQQHCKTEFSSPLWRQHTSQFGLVTDIEKLHRKAVTLFEEPLKPSPAGYLFEQYTDVIDGLRHALRIISDRSNLTLDPELESYYMMELAVNQLPQLIEYIGRARGIGSGLAASTQANSEEKILFRERITAIAVAIENMLSAINTILKTAPQLNEVIKPISNEAHTSANRFIEASKTVAANTPPTTDAMQYFRQGTDVINVFENAHQRISKLLVTQLQNRRHSLSQLQTLTAIGALLSAMLIIYFISSFYAANRSAFKKIEHLSITDALTGLYNRRYFYQIMPRELLRARREKKSFAFGILDIDHFKRYNDIYGHLEGDRILKQVAGLLQDSLQRASDYLFRIGGEEFCFIVSGADEREIKCLLEQMTLSILALEIKHEGNNNTPYVTASIGLAYLEVAGETNMDEIVKCADDSLYRAKGGGRNCWCLERMEFLDDPVSEDETHNKHNRQFSSYPIS
jgi:diguanylate cyclase (GGDEF)-like protein